MVQAPKAACFWGHGQGGHVLLLGTGAQTCGYEAPQRVVCLLPELGLRPPGPLALHVPFPDPRGTSGSPVATGHRAIYVAISPPHFCTSAPLTCGCSVYPNMGLLLGVQIRKRAKASMLSAVPSTLPPHPSLSPRLWPGLGD